MPSIIKFIAKPFKRKPYVDSSYYYNGLLFYTDISALQPRQEEDDDDCSMITIDTMETMDDNPGTGRTVDKYFFQPIGRKIERFAMRITIASLPPWKITQYLDDNLELYSGIPHCKVGIGQALTFLGRLKRGSTVITRLKSLVKQTR